MESRRDAIRNHKLLSRLNEKTIWIDRLKSFFITCFCLSLIVIILLAFIF